jgi:hypothetical protein
MGVAVSPLAVNTMQVWPNPAQQQITVQVNAGKGGSTQLVLLNVMGIKVATWTIENNKPAALQLELPSGVYLLTAGDGPEKLSTRIIIE